MKKRSTIILITVTIITFGVFAYYSSHTEANKDTDKTESIVTDKNGEIVEPLKEDDGNLGH